MKGKIPFSLLKSISSCLMVTLSYFSLGYQNLPLDMLSENIMIKHKIWWKVKLRKTQPRILKNGNSNIKLSNGDYGSYGSFFNRVCTHSDQMSFLRNKLKLDLGGMDSSKVKQFIDKKVRKNKTNEYTVKRKNMPYPIRPLKKTLHSYHSHHFPIKNVHQKW